MIVRFRYGGFDRRVLVTSIATLVVVAGSLAYLFWEAQGAYYFAAWCTSIIVAVMALCLLSVPRRIILRDEELELRCLVETTYIPLRSIVDVEVLGPKGLRGKLPLLSSGGFGGYLGFWVDLRRWKIHRTYVTHRRKCVAIHTSRRRYLVSCCAPELLRSEILASKARSANNE